MCNRMRILKNIIWSTAKIPTDMVCVLQASESHWLNVCLIAIRPKVCEICSIYMGYYCSFHNVEENSQLLRYLKWMSALGLAVRFQAEWRSEKAFPLFQIMLFSRVFQSVRDECWVVRMAPSNTFLAQLSLVGLSWVTRGCSQADFVLLPFSASSEEKIFLSASMARADGAWVADRETQCRSLVLGPAHGEVEMLLSWHWRLFWNWTRFGALLLRQCFTLVAKFLCYYAVINLAFLPSQLISEVLQMMTIILIIVCQYQNAQKPMLYSIE